jgi:hypothetical protein
MLSRTALAPAGFVIILLSCADVNEVAQPKFGKPQFDYSTYEVDIRGPTLIADTGTYSWQVELYEDRFGSGNQVLWQDRLYNGCIWLSESVDGGPFTEFLYFEGAGISWSRTYTTREPPNVTFKAKAYPQHPTTGECNTSEPQYDYHDVTFNRPLYPYVTVALGEYPAIVFNEGNYTFSANAWTESGTLGYIWEISYTERDPFGGWHEVGWNASTVEIPISGCDGDVRIRVTAVAGGHSAYDVTDVIQNMISEPTVCN